VLYVTGTRADYGLMRSTLQLISRCDQLELEILVTGMHLDARYGHTVREIRDDQMHIAAEVAIDMQPETAATMARNIGRMTEAFVEALERSGPDIVLLLGDRGEMLAAATAALHLGITIVHIHGGERSGTVDEAIRHAVSKMAHFHFAATEASCERLVRLGEAPGSVFVTGAPGLDGLTTQPRTSRDVLCTRLGLNPVAPLALMVFHPVVQQAADSGKLVREVLTGLSRCNCQVLALMPNADAGGAGIRDVLGASASQTGIRVVNHLHRDEFVSWMAAADVMVGNSSSGIIEAASFGTPVLNIGSRQNLRERSANVVDVEETAEAIAQAVNAALANGRREVTNVYGDGQSGPRITQLLCSIDLNAGKRVKVNAY
jgi:GDP/UDP-N,N'-diacetylbacillosamine 2-epimerase (hydrolysing)